MWLIFIIATFASSSNSKSYHPTWNSLDSRPLPSWYDRSKFGIFCHWGIYSVPSMHEWFWWYWKGDDPKPDIVQYMKQAYKPGFSYADFAPSFNAEFFNASYFADIVKHSEASYRYFVLTSKHHEGYTLWPSKYSWNWNSIDVGPHRDLIAEFKAAFQTIGGVHFGLYFSQFEWFNRLYISDRNANFTTSKFVDQVSYPEMLEIINEYKPEIVWSDGDWEAPDFYWKSKHFLAWLYNRSPVKDTVVVNDRWGQGTTGKHGGYLTFADRFDPGHIVPRKWENCLSLDRHSWGYRRQMTCNDVLSSHEILVQLVRTISCGGNLLLNVGPTKEGLIDAIFEERLRNLGRWLQINGEAVFHSKPWIYQNDSKSIWYTSRVHNEENLDENRLFNPQVEQNTVVYVFILDWPLSNQLLLSSIKTTAKTRAQMLGHNHFLSINATSKGALVDLSALDWKSLPSLDGWVLRLEYLLSENRNPLRDLDRTTLKMPNPENFRARKPIAHEKLADSDTLIGYRIGSEMLNYLIFAFIAMVGLLLLILYRSQIKFLIRSLFTYQYNKA